MYNRKVILPVCVIFCFFGANLSLAMSCCPEADAFSCGNMPKNFQITQDDNGTYWFVDPKGNRFLSIGVNTITPAAWRPVPETDHYNALEKVFDGNFSKWQDSVKSILTSHGFNTIGSWSDPNLYDDKLYGTITLYVAGYARERCLEALKPDFEQTVRKNTELMLKRYKNINNVIGFFLDNEMAWYGKSGWDDIPNYTLLDVALELDSNETSNKRARQFLQNKYKTIDAFSTAWGKQIDSWEKIDVSFTRGCLNENTQIDRAEFTGYVAEEFFSRASKTVRKMLPGKLILGVRFAGNAPDKVIQACGKYSDVMSYNNYQTYPEPELDVMARFYVLGGKKPLMITEYSWRAKQNQSGNPNTKGAGTVVKTQAERAERYYKYNTMMYAYPMVVGTHWFEFADQSPQGRFDGEDSNYGIVDINHQPYTELLNAMKTANTKLKEIHKNSDIEAPTELPKKTGIIFEIGQHPDKPALIDILKTKPLAEMETFYADDADLEISAANSGELILDYETGKDWGCGITFFASQMFKVEGANVPAANLDGYSRLVIDAKIPQSLSFDVIVDEAGVNAANLVNYDTSAGDDGESFIFKTQFGAGNRKKYDLHLKNLLERTNWGNQNGSRRVDMNALKGISLHIHGGQGKGIIEIYSLEFKK